MAKRRIGILAVALCLCLVLMPCRARAASAIDVKEQIDTDKNCSLTISYCYGDVAFSELPVKLYKIADVSADFQYTLTAAFAGSSLILDGIQTAGEWNVIRSTLEAYILANGVAADENGITDATGKVSFASLKAGLYLAVTDRVMRDEITYAFDGVLTALPGLRGNGLWRYAVDVTAKPGVIPPGDQEEIELKVWKLWRGDSGKTSRPQSIEVEIFRNGASHHTASLSSENHWTYTWTAKDDGAQWTVVERNIPTGYTMTVEERETSFVITNTLTQDDPGGSKPPQTGDTANVMLWIVLMILSGSMLVILGIIGKRNRVR